MKRIIELLVLFLVALPLTALSWEGRVCNESDQSVRVQSTVTASSPFDLNTGPHSDSDPYDVSGLCISGIKAWDTTGGTERAITTGSGGWGSCTNMIVFVTGNTPENMVANGQRTQIDVSCNR